MHRRCIGIRYLLDVSHDRCFSQIYQQPNDCAQLSAQLDERFHSLEDFKADERYRLPPEDHRVHYVKVSIATIQAVLSDVSSGLHSIVGMLSCLSEVQC